jgi:uncharacterized protein YbjT (DUF2867 family)
MPNDDATRGRVLVAGATGYLGRYVTRAFKQRGYWVRALTRSAGRLEKRGPFGAPAITADDVDDIFVGEATKPETLTGLVDGIDIVFSSIGISRQRDGLSFAQVDHQANRNLIDLCRDRPIRKFTYVSMLGAEQIADLAITRAHEAVVHDLERSGLPYSIVRPSGYFSDMGAVLDMAKRGRVYLVGDGHNEFNPIHGRDLAEVCVDAAEGSDTVVEAGGPEILSQRDLAAIAFDVVGKPMKVTVLPAWLLGGLVRGIRLLSTQFGDLAEFIVTSGEVDGVGPRVGRTTVREYYEALMRGDPDA